MTCWRSKTFTRQIVPFPEETGSMRNRQLVFEGLETRDYLSADVGFFAVGHPPIDPPPAVVEWQTQVGGPSYQEARSVVTSPDGGFVAVGWTHSDGAGQEDAYAVKVDQEGNAQWQSTFGGAELDRAYSVEKISTGGYIISGRTRSDHLTTNYESGYVARISEQGDLVWEKALGHRRASGARYAEETDDGGFIIAGWTAYEHLKDSSNVYVVKTDADGDIEWERQYQRKRWQGAHEIHQTSDGGYVISGIARPRKSPPMKLNGYMMKLDESGDVQWQRMLGTRKGHDELYTVEETAEGDFVFAGGSQRWISGTRQMGTWIVKTTPEGKVLWNRWYGGGFGYMWGSTLTSDGGLALVGRTSNKANIALLKVDADGRREWGMKLGSVDDGHQYWDGGRSIVTTSDGGFVLVGYLGKERGEAPSAKIQPDWDRDFWLVKLKPVIEPDPVQL
jgi:hypothetical protein